MHTYCEMDKKISKIVIHPVDSTSTLVIPVDFTQYTLFLPDHLLESSSSFYFSGTWTIFMSVSSSLGCFHNKICKSLFFFILLFFIFSINLWMDKNCKKCNFIYRLDTVDTPPCLYVEDTDAYL